MLSDEQIEDLLEVGNPTDEEKRLIRMGWDAAQSVQEWEPVPAKACIKPTHEAADAFWEYWKAKGETHKHGYYESTWGAINKALACGWTQPAQAQAGAVPRYRLLVRGQDTIQADDEFLREDGATWLKDPSGIFVGCMYEGTIFLPARRAIDEAHGLKGGQHDI